MPASPRGDLAALRERFPDVPAQVLLKTEIMFRGVRFTDALEKAAPDAMPGFYPHRLPPAPGETKGRAVWVPYIFAWPDGTTARVKVDDSSAYAVREQGAGYHLFAGDEDLGEVGFLPRPKWHSQTLEDGTPAAHSGVSQHGDMLVVNVAPGCDYFTQKDDDGRSRRCTFCAYGRFDARSAQLGQKPFETEIPGATLDRAAEALKLAAPEATQVYLVGGSMLDPDKEGERYLELTRVCRDAAPGLFLAVGSGAVDQRWSAAFKDAGADGVCYNLEVWHPGAFDVVCSGKSHFVGRERWLRALEDAAEIFGPGQVCSAMVAGVELFDPSPLAGDDAAALGSALEGAEWLISRGIQPLYSPFWPVPGTPYKDGDGIPMDYYLEIARGAHALRAAQQRPVNTQFVNRSSSYMQVEADMDHAHGLSPEAQA